MASSLRLPTMGPGRSTHLAMNSIPMNAMRKLILAISLLSSAIVATIYGGVFVGLGITPYTLYLERATTDAGQHFRDWGVSPPKREQPPTVYHCTEWSEGLFLPCRYPTFHDAAINWNNSANVWVFDVWETAGFDHNELNTFANDLLARRTCQVWDAPVGVAVPVAIIISGGFLGAAVFLLMCAISRAMMLAFQLPDPNAKAHILSATAFSACILCWFPKFAIVGFALSNPPIRRALYSPNWDPWLFAQDLSDYSLYHVAWAIFITVLCWCGLGAIVSALRYASIRSSIPKPLCVKGLRLLLWSLPISLTLWFGLSILVSQPITWQFLLPLDLYH